MQGLSDEILFMAFFLKASGNRELLEIWNLAQKTAFNAYDFEAALAEK